MAADVVLSFLYSWGELFMIPIRGNHKHTDMCFQLQETTGDHLLPIMSQRCGPHTPLTHAIRLHKPQILHRFKSFRNASEQLKCGTITVSLKWSLTFHSVSCLSLLMASASWSRYVRDSSSVLRTRLGGVSFKFAAKDHVWRRSLRIDGLGCIRRREGSLSFQLRTASPQANSALSLFVLYQASLRETGPERRPLGTSELSFPPGLRAAVSDISLTEVCVRDQEPCVLIPCVDVKTI